MRAENDFGTEKRRKSFFSSVSEGNLIYKNTAIFVRKTNPDASAITINSLNCDTTTLKTVYYALIYSNLQYCVSTWGLASTTALDPLVRIQKRIIRIITNSPFLSHTNPLFQKLNFLKIKDIVKLEIAKTMFCFNKSSTKNESQTIISITQKPHCKTRLAAQ